MNRNSHRTLLLSIGLAAILATGALFIWSFAATWIHSVAQQLLGESEPDESLVFTVEGEPLIQSSSYGPTSRATVYRTLDGHPVANLEKYELQGGSSWLVVDEMPRENYGWYSRLLGFDESSGAPFFWYLVGDGQARGHSFFMGFDAKTRNPIGYLGTAGFRADRPPLEEQFEIDARQNGYWGLVAGQYANMGEEPYNYGQPGRPIFLNATGTLFRIDTAHRSVVRVPLDGKVMAVANVEQPVRVPDEPKAITRSRVVARLADRAAILDDAGKTLRSISLPAEIRDRTLTVNLTTGPDAVVVAMADLHHELTEIYWLAPAGESARRETVSLRGGYFQGGQEPTWVTAVRLPAPLLCAIGYAVWRPLVAVQYGLHPDYASALAASLVEAWPSFAAVVGISAVLAVIGYRRQMRFGGRGATAWAVFVLVSGPAGFVAYLVHRHWPAVERCRACGAMVPRDRKECLGCDASFPAPAARGIEIFA